MNTPNNKIYTQEFFSVLTCNIWVTLKTVLKLTDRIQKTNLTISDLHFLELNFMLHGCDGGVLQLTHNISTLPRLISVK